MATDIPTDLEANVVAAKQALAAADLAVLQTLGSDFNDPSTTVAQITTAFATATASLGDPDRIGAVQKLQSSYGMLADNITDLIARTNDIANPSA